MSPPIRRFRARRWRCAGRRAGRHRARHGDHRVEPGPDPGARDPLAGAHPGAGLFTATNHIVADHDRNAGEYLLVWAGDVNVADNTVDQLVDRVTQHRRRTSSGSINVELPDLLPGQDFLAVVDAEPTSSTYGKVVNTVTLSPLVENEPHHMQYIWHKGPADLRRFALPRHDLRVRRSTSCRS